MVSIVWISINGRVYSHRRYAAFPFRMGWNYLGKVSARVLILRVQFIVWVSCYVYLLRYVHVQRMRFMADEVVWISERNEAVDSIDDENVKGVEMLLDCLNINTRKKCVD